LSSLFNLVGQTMHSEGFLRGGGIDTILDHVHLAPTLHSQIFNCLSTTTDDKSDFVLGNEHVHGLDSHVLEHLQIILTRHTSNGGLGCVLVDNTTNLLLAHLNTLSGT